MLKLLTLITALTLFATPALANNTTLDFEPGQKELTKTHQTTLTQNILPALKNTTNTLEITIYATAPESKTSLARRTSLTRGLAIRTYLIKHNIPKEHIFLKPMGNTQENAQNSAILKILQK